MLIIFLTLDYLLVPAVTLDKHIIDKISDGHQKLSHFINIF
jgi:hypothetical protein